LKSYEPLEEEMIGSNAIFVETGAPSMLQSEIITSFLPESWTTDTFTKPKAHGAKLTESVKIKRICPWKRIRAKNKNISQKKEYAPKARGSLLTPEPTPPSTPTPLPATVQPSIEGFSNVVHRRITNLGKMR
jgi:hypothetical protein